jgi:hypothetical protein
MLLSFLTAVFAPSVTWRKLFIFLYQMDQALLRGIVHYSIMKLEKALVGQVNIHPVGKLSPRISRGNIIYCKFSLSQSSNLVTTCNCSYTVMMSYEMV